MRDHSFQPQIFRTPAWVIALTILGAVLFPLAAVAIYVNAGWSWHGILAMAISPVALAGAVDAWTTYVCVSEDELEFRSNFRKRILTRSECMAVTWARGCPVSLQLRDGAWITLPEVSRSSPGMANTLRAWLKRAPRAD